MTSAMTPSTQMPPTRPNGPGSKPNSGIHLMRLLRHLGTCRNHSWMSRQSRTLKISVFPENLNNLKFFQVTCPNQLGMLRNFRTRLTRIQLDIRTYRDHRKNSQNSQTPKMQLPPENATKPQKLNYDAQIATEPHQTLGLAS